MEDRFSISVILPCYNNAGTLYKCLESINNQELNFELIFVNDGSIDESLTIFHDFKFNNNISVKIINRENKGFLTSLNEAITLSSGEYISRIDADDLWTSNHLKSILKEFKKNPEYVLIGSQCILINDFNLVIGYSDLPTNHNRLIKFFHKDNPFIHSSVVFKRQIYLKTGGYYKANDPFFSHIADFNLWFEFSKYGLCKNLKQKSVYYRVSEKSMSRSINIVANLKSRLYVISKVNDFYKSYKYYYFIQKFKLLLQITFYKLIN